MQTLIRNESMERMEEKAPGMASSGSNENKVSSISNPKTQSGPSATRKSLQLGRRGFHFFNGAIVASTYGAFLTHQQAVYLIGTLACVLYILEQIRINYPELQKRVPGMERLLLRAEEQFKESAMVPYAIAVLLSIITFPKTVALVAICTLALADPVSAIIGIRFGRHHWVSGKSLEGSFAFFITTFGMTCLVLGALTMAPIFAVLGVSFLVGLLAAGFEVLPIKLDDNLTIPLFVGFTTWFLCIVFSISL